MDLSELEIREMRPEELDECLVFRNSIFTFVGPEHYQAMGNTAALARRGGELVGFIPLQFRDFLVSPGLAVPVVFENAVGVHESVRSTGIGTAMLECAAGFMRDRVDALFVYRGGERTNGYRFYRRTGHGDLYYEHWLTREIAPASAGPTGVECAPASQAVTLERELLGLFERSHRGFAGYWRRGPGYFAKVLASHVYKNDSWRLFTARSGGELVGYAMVNPECKRRGWPTIYDIAANDDAALGRLLSAIDDEYRPSRKLIAIPSTPEHPIYRRLLAAGFRFDHDDAYVMARILNADRIFARRAAGSPLLADLELTAVTPHRDVVVNKPPNPKHRATLHLKESSLSRLLLSRLDLAQALRMNTVRLSPLPEDVFVALEGVFGFTPWVSFAGDYV
jgi:GNAT superfamily N-acetyltransferase